jgi:4-hydroxy-tetrahydrodipicolinate reductase
MGRAAVARAREAGHEIGVVLTSRDARASVDELVVRLRGHAAAIDFSVAEAALAHVTACGRAGVPLVLGTTGWQGQLAEVRRELEECRGALVYGANFSIGVNLFYRLVDRAGELLRGLDAYGAFIEEAHHAKKRDAPSGTALELRRLLAQRLGHDVPVASTRAGHIPGVHRVGFDSAADEITLTHSARSRDGFAAGAVSAAAWLAGDGRHGVYAFGDILDEVLAAERKGQR